MNDKIYVLTEYGKPVEAVLATSCRKGYVFDGGDWLEHIANISISQALSKSELRECLHDFLYHLKEAVTPNLNKLRLKDIRIHSGCYEDLDSTNASHANVYYVLAIELPDYVKPWLEQDQDVFTLDEIKAKRFDLV